MRTVKATMDEHGHIELLEPVSLDAKKQVLIVIPEGAQVSPPNDVASALRSQWSPEEVELDIQERNAAKRFLSGCLIVLAVGFALYMILTALMFRAFTP